MISTSRRRGMKHACVGLPVDGELRCWGSRRRQIARHVAEL